MNFRRPRQVHFYGGDCSSGSDYDWRMDDDAKRQALISFMERHGLKPTPWAERAKVSRGALSNYLAGRSRSLSVTTMERLALAAGASIAEIIGESVDNSESGNNILPLEEDNTLNLQLMVQLLRKIVDQQARTNDLLQMLLARGGVLPDQQASDKPEKKVHQNKL